MFYSSHKNKFIALSLEYYSKEITNEFVKTNSVQLLTFFIGGLYYFAGYYFWSVEQQHSEKTTLKTIVITFITQKKGKDRGNHYHKKTIQWNYLIKGKVALYAKKHNSKIKKIDQKYNNAKQNQIEPNNIKQSQIKSNRMKYNRIKERFGL